MHGRSRGTRGGGRHNGTTIALLVAVALASLAVVLALVAVRNANANSENASRPDTNIYPSAPDRPVQVNPSLWNVPNPAFPPPYPPPAPTYLPTYPPVRVADRMLDVRVHSPTGGPPLHPFAIAAGEPFRQVGIVYSVEADKRYPLFSRQAPYRRNRYQYYVSTDNSSIQISARAQGRDCGEELGCDELYTDDMVNVPELGEPELKVKLFNK